MTRRTRQAKIGLLHSLTGIMAISERPLLDAELLAIEEINRSGGILGRLIDPTIRDGASSPLVFAQETQEMLTSKVSTIFGCWTSASRKAVKSVMEDSDGLLWYPVQYEGLEESPNIVYTGSCPNQQIIPAIEWILSNLGNRIFLVGSDYVFPRAANVLVRSLVEEHGGSIAGEQYFPLENKDFGSVIEQIRQTKSSAVFNTINGESNLWFYRQYHEAGIRADKIPIIAVSASETEMQHIADTAAGHLACWSYFQSFDNPENLQFVARFRERYGSSRVCSDPMAIAYSQIYLWKNAVERSGSFDAAEVRGHIAGCEISGPAGHIAIEANHHIAKRAFIGRLDVDGQFKVVWSSPEPIDPLPWLGAENVDPAGRSLIKECMGAFSESLHYSTLLEQQLKERRRLEDALQEANRQLEARVAERTAELDDAVQGMKQEISERKETETALRASQERLQVIFNRVNDVIFLHDPISGAIVDTNERAIDLYGWSREELLQNTVEDLSSGVPPYTLDEALKKIRKASSGESQMFEWQARHRSGRLIWVEVSLRRAKIGGALLVVAVVRDVTERHEAEEALKRSQERYKAVVDCMPVGIVLHYDFIIRYANPAAVRVAKLDNLEEMLGRPIWDFIDPGMHQVYKERYIRVLNGETAVEKLDGRLIDSKGNVIFVEGTSIKIPFDSEIGILSTFTDVSERRNTETALRKSEQRFRTLVTASSQVIYRMNSDWTELCNLSGGGFIADTAEPNRNWLADYIPEEEQPRVTEAIDQAISTRSTLELEHRVVRADGTIGWTHSRAVPLLDESGKIVEWFGEANDITQRVEAEQALRESEERFRIIATSSPDHLLVQDKELRYRFVLNPQLGLTSDDMLGRTDYDFLPPDEAEMLENTKRRVIETGESVHVTMPLVSRDGSVGYFDGSYVPKFDSEGKVDGLIGYFRNVTDVMRAEKALREATEFLETALAQSPSGILIADAPDVSIRMANPVALGIRGGKPSLLTGIDVAQHSARWQTFRPDGSPYPPEQLPLSRAIILGEVTHDEELLIRDEEGSDHWVSANAAPIRNAAGEIISGIVVFHDVTERKQAEVREKENAAHRRDFYRRTILAATEGKLIITDREDIEELCRNVFGSWSVVDEKSYSRMRDEISELATEEGMPEDRLYDFLSCVAECVTNAIKHAGGGEVRLCTAEDAVILVASDNGPGIDALELPDVALTRGYSTAGTMGMGYKIMIGLADKVYLATGPGGTTVGLEMKLRSDSDDSAPWQKRRSGHANPGH